HAHPLTPLHHTLKHKHTHTLSSHTHTHTHTHNTYTEPQRTDLQLALGQLASVCLSISYTHSLHSLSSHPPRLTSSLAHTRAHTHISHTHTLVLSLSLSILSLSLSFPL